MAVKEDQALRIIHTSDWHLGKTLEGRERLTEQQQFIQELSGIVRETDADLILIAGDIFDTANPPAKAEQLFYDALDLLSEGGRRGIVVIAGNHDHPERVGAALPLAYRHGIMLFGSPGTVIPQFTPPDKGRVHVLESGPDWVELGLPRSGQRAVIAGVPYLSESRLRERLSESIEEEAVQQAYSLRVGQIYRNLSGRFQRDTVNIALGHLFVQGGRNSESERDISLGGACAVDPSMLPSTAHYVALGHLHRPQTVPDAPTEARYSGSPLAYSFSEAGYAKVVYLVEANPGERTKVTEIPLTAGRPLVKWEAKNGLAEVLAWCEEGRDQEAFIDLTVHVPATLDQYELQQLKSRRPLILHIRPVLPQMEEKGLAQDRRSMSIRELFTQFYARKNNNQVPDEELVRLFLELAETEDLDTAGEVAEL